jgi:hypothetical protein
VGALWLALLVLALVRPASAETRKTAGPQARSGAAPGGSHPTVDTALEAALPKAARANYSDAMDLSEAGDYAGALLKFEVAYTQSRDPRLLWDLAVCEKALRHYANALPLVRRYLVEAASLIKPAEREEAEGLAEAISNFVGPVQIEGSQSGATVMIDDVVVGKTPLAEPIVVDMGDRKITLTKRGYKDAKATVRVLGPGEPKHVFLRMDRDIPAATLEVVAGSGQWISVDQEVVGRNRWDGLVRQGKHVIKVTGAGYKPKEVEADLSNGGHVSIWVVAQPLEQAEKANYWPLIGAIGGATAVVAVVAYIALRPSTTNAQPLVNGQLATISEKGK